MCKDNTCCNSVLIDFCYGCAQLWSAWVYNLLGSVAFCDWPQQASADSLCDQPQVSCMSMVSEDFVLRIDGGKLQISVHAVLNAYVDTRKSVLEGSRCVHKALSICT